MEFFKLHDKYGSIIELYKFFNKVTGVPIASAILALTATVAETKDILLDIPSVLIDEYSTYKED